jgi:hypothetical protein
MQIHESEIAFISFLLFFGIGTFQRVAADSNTKNPARVSRFVQSLSLVRFLLLIARSAAVARTNLGFDYIKA